jgi:transketolase
VGEAQDRPASVDSASTQWRGTTSRPPGSGTASIDTFGASAPYKALAARFGFTVDNVVAQARAVLARLRAV